MAGTVYDDAFATAGDVASIGSLRIPTGKIVACDPYFCSTEPPFGRAVPPGDYEVQLRLVESDDWGLRVALARVVLSPDARTVDVEEAFRESTGSNAYLVDSGVGSFMDLRARDAFAEVLEEHYRQNPTGNYYTDVLAAELARNAPAPDQPGKWVLHELPGADLNVAIFSSGLGDGSYQSFWGLDARGEPTSLVTDFGLL
jgi:hypothetical protein